MHEAQMHEQNCFVTLTYDDEHLPDGNSLDVKEWQRFMKRLRKSLGASSTRPEARSVRFFHCGEYGDTWKRPHYHAILFGLDFSEDRVVWRAGKAATLWRSPTLERIWGCGFCTIGEASFESAAYVARYAMKKQRGKSAKEYYENFICPRTGEVGPRKPEYVTMSRNKGIGASWVAKFQSDVYPSDEVIVNGKKCRPPKFYDGRFELEDPEAWAMVKGRRIRKAQLQADDNTPERLRVKELVSELKGKAQIRDLE